MRPGKPGLTGFWQAMDEVSFGQGRTLNLRDSLPGAEEARARTEVWLKARQVTDARDVLVITGRGNQSMNGIGVIRREILALLPSLRRRGIIDAWKEHTPGSFIISLAPINALLEAPRRRRSEPVERSAVSTPASLAALEPETLRLLHELAIQNLDMIGIVASGSFVAPEMERTFAMLAGSITPGPDMEKSLRDAISHAINESE